MIEIEKKIIKAVEDNKKELMNLLKDLISIPSENEGIPDTGKETEVQNFVHEKLLNYDFDNVEKISSSNSCFRPNIVGTIKGKKKKKALILNAHSDVVPVKEEERKKWTSDPYKPVIKDGNVYGRGASDCKGGLASIIIAAKVLKELKTELKNDLYVASTVGEESQEGETIGASLIVDRGYKAAFAVIAEPSNSEIHIESPGVFFFELRVKGKEAHTGARNQILFPQRYGLKSGVEVGVDAIQKAIPFIEMFQRLEVENNHKWKSATLSGGGYPVPMDMQGLGYFTMTPTLIKGGEYIGAVAGYVSIIYVVWYPNWLKEEDVAIDIKNRVLNLSATDDWLRENPPEFIYPTLQYWKPFKTSINHMGVQLLGKSLSDIKNKEPIYSASRFVCDGTFFQNKGIPSIILGPGGLNMAIHGPDEFVPIDELILCTKAYALFAYRWCNEIVF